MSGFERDENWPQPSSKKSRVKATIGVLSVGLVVGAAGGSLAMAAINGALGEGASSSLQGGRGPLTQVPSKPLAQAQQPSSTLGNTQLNVAQIAARVDPSVVDINTTLGAAGASYGQGAGTGMILTSSGEILTNNHVIAGASSITVQLPGNAHTYSATVLGVDPSADIALIKIAGAHGLKPITLGNSSAVTTGESVVAIGNALGLGGAPTVTNGIVSSLGRSISASDPTGAVEHLTGLIQTDAPINPGNSGGPLVNASGQVIGMDTAAATGQTGQPASNVGFAIPINRAVSVVDQIRAGRSSNTVILSQPGFLGVGTQSINPAIATQVGTAASQGALVIQVVPGSPAASLGLSQGDVIVGVGSAHVSSTASLRRAVESHSPGSKVRVTWITTDGTTQSATIQLAAGPAL